MTEGTHLDGKIEKAYYFPVFLFQRMIFSGAIVIFYEMPTVAIIVLMLIHFLMIIYMGCLKPFASFEERASLMIDEAVIVLFLVYAFVILHCPNITEGKHRFFA